MITDFLYDYLPLIMFGALCCVIFSGYPLGFLLGGIALIFGLIGCLVDSFSLIQFFNFMPRIYDVVENPLLVSVPLFIFMGLLLEGSGLAEDLLHSLQVILRRVPGGLAIGVNIVGTVLGAPIGIVSASVVMLSLVALPTMMDRGYSKSFSTGTIAASATLGILIPPSVMLVVMADLMGMSIGPLFYGAFMPGFLLSALFFAYIILVARARPQFAPPLGEDYVQMSRKEFWKLMWTGFMPSAVLLAATLGAIFAGWATPTESAGSGAFATLVLAWAKGRLNRQNLAKVVYTTTVSVGLIFVLYAGANSFSYVFRALGGDQLILGFIKGSGMSSWELLIMLMVVVFLLGLPFEWTEIMLILLPIIGPVLPHMDFGGHVEGQDIVTWVLVLMAINLQTSYLSPPFGFALFYVKGSSPDYITMTDIFRGCIPFMTLQLVGVIACMAFPSVVLWLPKVWIS
jgi:tripartite ATP-independent transporter DctM subunit